MDIRPVPALKDNYAFLVVNELSGKALIIDPAEEAPIIKALAKENLTPVAIWITHHHGDHTGGIKGIVKHYGMMPVVCSEKSRERIPYSNQGVKDGSTLNFEGRSATVLELPGHSDDHLGYYFASSGDLFSGDVLFGASCGAVFTNTYMEMYSSLARIKKLPPDTRIWCGHEYTGNNLGWAKSVLGERALSQRIAKHKIPSVPLILSEELLTNPFLRLSTPEVRQYTQTTDEEVAFKALRLLKDKAL